MSHKNMKIKGPKATVRRMAPVMGKEGGKDMVMCPYCDPPHPISTLEVSNCGTMLEINAVQAVFKGQKCALCGQTNGQQVMAANKYVHAHECTPGRKVFATPPKKYLSARLMWKLPDFFQVWVARKFGRVVLELKNGENKVTGYTWQKVNIHAETEISVSGRGNPGVGS